MSIRTQDSRLVLSRNRRIGLLVTSAGLLILHVGFFTSGLRYANAATTYYVDAAGGVDTASGISEATAWKTLYKVSGHPFVAGDTILLKRGAVWHEAMQILNSGTEGAPITYSAYGTGPAPVIHGGKLLSGWTAYNSTVWQLAEASDPDEMFLDGVRGVNRWGDTIADLAAQGEWLWEDGTIYLYCTQNPDLYYSAPGIEISSQTEAITLNADWIRIENLELRLSHMDLIRSVGENNVLQGNTLRLAGDDCIEILGSHTRIVDNQLFGGANGIWVHDTMGNTLSGNLVHACGSGVNLQNVHHTLVMGNTVTSCFTSTAPGLLLEDSSNNQFIGNYVSQNRDGISQRAGTTGCQDNVFYQNRIFANHADGLSANNANGHGTVIAYNLIFENLRYGLVFEGANTNNRIENNTIYGNGDCGIFVTATASDWVIQNNILALNQPYEIFNSSSGTVTTSHNAYSHSSGYVVVNKGFPYILATLNSFEPTAIREDPVMTDPAAHQFALQWNSPCRDAGLTLGYSRDANGQPVPLGAGTDIGALEYVSSPHMENLAWSEVAGGNFFTGTGNNLVGQINCSGYQSDHLLSVQVENLGTAVGQTDIETVWVWYSSGGGAFNPFQAQKIGAMTWVTDRRWRLNLDQEVLDGSALYLTVDVHPMATQGSTCRFSVPAGGCAFLWGQALPNAVIANVGSQLLQYRNELQMQIKSLSSSHVLRGQRDLSMLEITLSNLSGRSLDVATLAFEIQNTGGQAVPLSGILENMRVEINGVERGAVDTPTALDPQLVFSPVLTLPNQSSSVMTLRADCVNAPNLSAFRMVFRDELCINAGSLAVNPSDGEIFPLRSGQVNIRESRLESVFSCYPNPFSGSRQPAAIPYYLEKTSQVRIWVQTLTGAVVRELVNQQQAPGLQKTQWDGKNSIGQDVKSGVYLLTIRLDQVDGQRQELRRKIAVAH